MVRAVICCYLFSQFFAYAAGMIGKLLKESILGRWFVPAEMECFKDQALAAFGCGEPNLRGDDRAIAMSPENRSVDPQGIQNQQGLFRCPVMKIYWQWSG